MTDQNLRDLLEKVQNELKHVEATDEAGREKLRHLDADIRDLMQRSDEEMETDEPLLERLQETIEHFEETYPRFTMTLSQMMTILSNAGI